MKHIISGIIPDTEPNFNDLVEYYTRLLQKTANATPRDWTKECGQGYLCLTEDKNGNLKSAAVKFYGCQPNSTAILFSTKISSFGQDSFEDNSQANGDYRIDRYPTKTKTIISNSSGSFSVGSRNRSPSSSGNISDNAEPEESTDDGNKDKQKLTWEYTPKTPPSSPLPEILFESYSGDKNENVAYSEEFLRLILFIIDHCTSFIANHNSCSVVTSLRFYSISVHPLLESSIRTRLSYVAPLFLLYNPIHM